MLKREIAIRQLIANGYDDALATELPKLFIADFFEREQEKLSEALDIFIDWVQKGYLQYNAYGNVMFGGIKKMEDIDMDRNSVSGLFYNFNSHITEEFDRIVKRQPLQNILLEGGAMKYHSELESFSRNPVLFEKEIVGSPEKYRDLCEVSPYHGTCSKSPYIKASDFYLLLLSKGFCEESISHLFGEYDTESKLPKVVSTYGIHLKYDDVMAIGTSHIKNPTYTKNLKENIDN